MKKGAKRYAAMLLAMLLAAAALMGCGSSGSGEGESGKEGNTDKPSAGKTVTVTYWHTHGDGEEAILKEKLIPEFEKQNEGIKIKPVRMPYDGLKQQVIQGVSSGTAPDLMRLDIIWTPEFAKMGALVCLDDMDGFAELKDTLFEGPLSTNLSEGKYYGLPLNTNTKTGIYSKEMMEKLGLAAPPKTLDEVIALKEKLGPEEYLIGADGANTWSLAPWFYSLGGVYTNADFTKADGYFNSDASVKAMETLSQWYDEGIISPALLGGKPDKSNGLFQGKVLLADEGPWMFTSNTEEDLAKVEAGLLPAGNAGSISVVGGENLVMFSSGKNHEAAWTFAKFLMSEFAQKTMAVEAGLIPTVKSIAESDEVKNVPNMGTYVEQLNTATARTPHHNWEKMSDKIGKCMEAIIRHEADVKTEMDKIALELDQLLAE